MKITFRSHSVSLPISEHQLNISYENHSKTLLFETLFKYLEQSLLNDKFKRVMSQESYSLFMTSISIQNSIWLQNRLWRMVLTVLESLNLTVKVCQFLKHCEILLGNTSLILEEMTMSQLYEMNFGNMNLNEFRVDKVKWLKK